MRQAPTAIESALKIDVGHAVHTGFFQLTETEVFVVFFFFVTSHMSQDVNKQYCGRKEK